MTKIKSLIALVLSAMFVFSLSFTILADTSESDKINERIDSALSYIKDTYAADFADGAETSTRKKADMWSTMLAVSSGKSADPSYQFLIEDVDLDTLGESTSSINYAKAILSSMFGFASLVGDIGNMEEIEDIEDIGDIDMDTILKLMSKVDELASRQTESGFFSEAGESANELSFIIFALDIFSGDYDNKKAVDALVSMRKTDGGYSWDAETDIGNVDTSGMVLMCLSASEYGMSKSAPTLAYLKGTLDQNSFFVGKDEYAATNSCSQAMGIIGMISAEGTTTDTIRKAVNALITLQKTNGGFLYMDSSTEPDYFSTYQSALALCLYNSMWILDPDDASVTSNSDASGLTSDNSTVVGLSSNTITQLTSSSGSPDTGDEGISTVTLVILGVAIVIMLACLLIPLMISSANKKKKQDALKPDNSDDSNTDENDSNDNSEV